MRALACVGLLLAASSAFAHGVHHQPDVGRMRRHAQRLSESCKRRGRTLDDACITDPEVTGGPYVWDQAPIRKDITEGWPGVPFVLNITVMNSTTCTEIAGAAVEIWHCTADGLYSHFIEASAGNGTDTDDTTFLRGIQYTDDNGVASFETIWPGWYLPRATHIHVRVHFNITETDEGYSGGTIAHTGQLFFNDSIVDEIAVIYPYTTNTDSRTALEDDQVVGEQGGLYGLTTVTEMYEGLGFTAGCIGTVTVGVDTTEASGSAASSSSSSSSDSDTDSPSSSSSSSGNGGDMPSGMGGDMGNMTGGGEGGERPDMPTTTTAPETVVPTVAPTVAPPTTAPSTAVPATPTPRSVPVPSEPAVPVPSAPQQPATPPTASTPHEHSHTQTTPSSPSSPSSPPCSQQQQQPQAPMH